MEKILISRNSLAERWDFESSQSIINYENEGILTRNPNIKAPRYYMEEVLKIEALKEVNPLSPLERKHLEKRIEELEKELKFYKEKINSIKMLLI
ncbi:hypothetical protein UT300005_05980 [Clostridium sp. CTA-5]